MEFIFDVTLHVILYRFTLIQVNFVLARNTAFGSGEMRGAIYGVRCMYSVSFSLRMRFTSIPSQDFQEKLPNQTLVKRQPNTQNAHITIHYIDTRARHDPL